MAIAKPFVKWAGGKGKLLEQLDEMLPAGFHTIPDVTYIEPFVGAGAMLFFMLQRYPNIHRAVINDINKDLTTCYHVIKNHVEELIVSLQEMQDAYYALGSEEACSAFYTAVKDRFNEKKLPDLENATKFIFLNKTGFNGLYRVNQKGQYNVPFGKNPRATICDAETLRKDSELLQSVTILTGEFEDSFEYAQGNTFFYFDPPYRPLSLTSNFNTYAKTPFNDDAQIRLKEYCDKIHASGYKFMLSNSDGHAAKVPNDFMDDLYKDYTIERVHAARSINSKGDKRGKITEILVHNYTDTKAASFVDNFQLEPMYVREEIEEDE